VGVFFARTPVPPAKVAGTLRRAVRFCISLPITPTPTPGPPGATGVPPVLFALKSLHVAPPKNAHRSAQSHAASGCKLDSVDRVRASRRLTNSPGRGNTGRMPVAPGGPWWGRGGVGAVERKSQRHGGACLLLFLSRGPNKRWKLGQRICYVQSRRKHERSKPEKVGRCRACEARHSTTPDLAGLASSAPCGRSLTPRPTTRPADLNRWMRNTGWNR
jgi:hypothetical protein